MNLYVKYVWILGIPLIEAFTSIPSSTFVTKRNPFEIKSIVSTQSLLLSQSIDNNISTASTQDDFDMPWSTNQEWALQDKISKYTINIPRLNNPTLKGGGLNKTTFALWHTMTNEVTELMGYEIDYLQMKYSALLEDSEGGKLAPPGVLPYIDDFEFRNNGGIKGRIYGLVGIESGTEIVTSPLKEVELTLPRGFALTGDGSCAYELGTPKSERSKVENFNRDSVNTALNSYSMDLSSMKEDGGRLLSDIGDKSGQVAGNAVKELGDPQTSQMVVNLAGTTAVVLGAATAMNMLSHHLTVNVFWV